MVIRTCCLNAECDVDYELQWPTVDTQPSWSCSQHRRFWTSKLKRSENYSKSCPEHLPIYWYIFFFSVLEFSFRVDFANYVRLPHSIDLTDSRVLVKASGDHFWADSKTGCWRPTEKRCDSMTRKSEGISWMSSTTSWTSDSASTFNSVLLNLLVRTDSKKNSQISHCLMR